MERNIFVAVFVIFFSFKTMKIPSCIGGLIHKGFAQQFEKIPHCLRQRLLDGFRIAVDTCENKQETKLII